eukprot:PLAT7763.1.p2 GENE.PLAT7763.1~~PLAT7763.1.p2  ORF type:complete len:421 (-),score=174.72 PLAT7763.1:32-1237(-)
MAAEFSDDDVCIISFARTAMGQLGGALSKLSAPELGAIAIAGALERGGVEASAVEEVFMGNVLQAGVGMNPARQAAVKAGIPLSVPATTVNKVCASGMKAVTEAARAIKCGDISIAVAGGMENMSLAPFYARHMRFGRKMGSVSMDDGMLVDGLQDPFSGVSMGECAEACAEAHSVTREEQDAHAWASFSRAKAAADGGKFTAIVPVEVSSRRGPPTVVVADEGPQKKTSEEALARLRPAFRRDGTGTVTAGTSSSIADGAVACVLASGAAARSLGLPVIARLRAYADAAHASEEFTTAPSLALPLALEKAGIEAADVDAWEINEAFSVVAVVNSKLLALEADKVNVFGGSVALGHPLGASGARLICTLLAVLTDGDGKIGAAAVCNGGGGATAVIIERLA